MRFQIIKVACNLFACHFALSLFPNAQASLVEGKTKFLEGEVDYKYFTGEKSLVPINSYAGVEYECTAFEPAQVSFEITYTGDKEPRIKTGGTGTVSQNGNIFTLEKIEKLYLVLWDHNNYEIKNITGMPIEALTHCKYSSNNDLALYPLYDPFREGGIWMR